MVVINTGTVLYLKVVVIDDNADRTNLRKKISEIDSKIANLEEMKANYIKQLEVLFDEEYE